ncbi:MAG: serine hydrolase [Isosphaera sp.]|nr:serine hydrolase [Isosphaera sp.]
MLALAVLLLAPAPTLEARIAPLAKAHKGKVAVAVKNLKTGEEFYLAADEVMPTASLIKLPVMVEAFWQAEEGKVKFDTTLTLKKDDKVPGSGILTPHFSDGATFPLKDAVRLMIVFSDNTATNLVLDQIAIPSTNERMKTLGMAETRVNAQVFKGSKTTVDPERSKTYGLGSTTARETVQLLELIEAGKVVSADACKEMLRHLRACDDKEMFARFLPAGVALAHKTGAVSDARTEAGIAYTKAGPVALCVLTTQNEDKRWAKDNAAELLLANVAKEVVEHFGGAPDKK